MGLTGRDGKLSDERNCNHLTLGLVDYALNATTDHLTCASTPQLVTLPVIAAESSPWVVRRGVISQITTRSAAGDKKVEQGDNFDEYDVIIVGGELVITENYRVCLRLIK